MHVLILGGRSEIGVELATRLAAGNTVTLAARRAQTLAPEVARVQAAGASTVNTIEFDGLDTASHGSFLDAVETQFGPIDTAVVAFGILGDGPRAEHDAAHAVEITEVNYVGPVSILTHLATRLRARHSGTLVVFSSMAGVRVRKDNYVYGATKAAIDGFASGLSDSLAPDGVRVLVVRPGFVVGNMTADLMASGVTPAPFSRTAPQVADAVAAALRGSRTVVWVPGVLRPVAFVFRLLPQWLWRRLARS